MRPPDNPEKISHNKDLQLLLTLTQAITTAGDLKEAFDFTLKKICRTIKWEAGEVWMVDHDKRHLYFYTGYSSKNPAIEEFYNSSQQMALKPEEGLPGYAWKTKNSKWLEDINENEHIIRKDAAKKAGFKTGIAIPIPLSQEVFAVITLYSLQKREKDRKLLEVIIATAAQLGVYLKQKLTEEELMNSEMRFRSIVETSPEAIILSNRKGEIVTVNKMAEKMFGYTAAEIAFREADILKPERFRAKFKKRMKQYLDSGDVEILNEAVEMHGLRKDGTEFPAELIMGAWKSTKGETYFTEIVKDITAKKEAEEYQKRYQQIFENSDDSILSKKLDGTVLVWNPASEKIYGYSAEEMVGKNISITIPDEGKADHDELLNRVKKGERIQNFEAKRIRKDGEVIYMSLTISPIKDKTGKAVAASTIGREITERVKNQRELKKLYEELEQRVKERTKELSEFAYIVSHDLKAPLRAIKSLSDWIMEDEENNLTADSKKNLQLMKERVQLMSNMIESILQYSRAGKKAATKDEVNVNKLLEEIFSTIDVPENISIDVEPELPVVLYPRMQLFQVFQNLIDNAIKYNDKPEGKISIGANEEERRWVLYIKDNGAGIRKEDMKNIFKMFNITNKSKAESSSGIGLALVKKVVETNNGNIWVESEPGEGSTFYFSIPKK